MKYSALTLLQSLNFLFLFLFNLFLKYTEILRSFHRTTLPTFVTVTRVFRSRQEKAFLGHTNFTVGQDYGQINLYKLKMKFWRSDTGTYRSFA
jgi:hypothetical protein